MSAVPVLTAVPARLQGLCLAALVAFAASAASYPGRAYFMVTGLNDTTRPVGANVVLHPALVIAAVLLMLRWRGGAASSAAGHKAGVVAGMAIWGAGAALATIANTGTPLVALTFWSVFACGAAIYAAARGLDLAAREWELVLLGLVAGALFPLVLGLRAFVAEWGVPDLGTIMTAHLDPLRMAAYEDATFGNRGNTAAFLVVALPTALVVLCDRSARAHVRAACALLLVLGLLNLLVLEVRAAVLTLLFAVALVWRFWSRTVAGYAVFAALALVAASVAGRYAPDISALVSERFQPVLTLNQDDDASVAERSAAIDEGWRIARANWQVGIGPGAALTAHSMTAAHQMQAQQAMEAGVLGLAGSTLFVVSLLWAAFRAIRIGPADPVNRRRFALVLGPLAFAIYGVMANVTLNVGYVNTCTVLVVTWLALMPPFPSRRRLVAVPASVIARRQRLMSGVPC